MVCTAVSLALAGDSVDFMTVVGTVVSLPVDSDSLEVTFFVDDVVSPVDAENSVVVITLAESVIVVGKTAVLAIAVATGQCCVCR